MPYLPSFRVCCRWKQNSTYWQYFWWQNTEGQLRVLHSSRVSHCESNLEVWFVIKEDCFLKYWFFVGLTINMKFCSLFKGNRSKNFCSPFKSYSSQWESFLEFQPVFDLALRNILFCLKVSGENNRTLGDKVTDLCINWVGFSY